MPDPVRFWDVRRSQSTKPASYTCPLCGGRLLAMSEHMLLFPDGDHHRRRHAHLSCVLQARRRGTLPSRSEWQASQSSGRRRWPWSR